MLAPAGAGSLGLSSGRFALTHAAGAMASVAVMTAAASLRFMVAIGTLLLVNKRCWCRAPHETRKVQGIVERQDHAPSLVSAGDVHTHERLASRVQPKAGAIR